MGHSAREAEPADAGSGLKLQKSRIVQFPQSARPVPQPVPPKAESAPTKEKERRDPFVTSHVSRIILVFFISLPIALFLWGSSYLIKWAHREIGSPEPAVATTAQPPAPAPALVVTADMLHISSISLGKVRLAVVNGEQLKEGDSLKVKTPGGDATVFVTQIKDGIVRFNFRRRAIEVRMPRSAAGKVAAK
jgi:hypothetical protein